MIHFYGSPASSAGRTHWLLEELKVPYEYKRTSAREGQTQTPEFLAMNPSGKIPFLQDGDIKLFESVAINFYLAEKYGSSLWPASIEQRALVYQWSLWAITNLQPLIMDAMYNTVLLPEVERNAKVAEKARAGLPRYLDVLEGALTGAQFLVGDCFTVADINTASVVHMAPFVGCSVDAFPSVNDWLARLKARPAYRAAAAAG